MSENNLQTLALKLTAGEKTEEEKVEKLYRFVKEKIKYKLTIIGDAEKILKLGYGSCFDKSLLFAELLKFVGVKSRYHLLLVDFSLISNALFLFKLTPSLFKPPFYPHVFNEIYLGKKWVKMDTSFDSDLESYFLQKKLISGKKECCVPEEYILKDVGCFDNFFDIFTSPSLSKVMKFGIHYNRKALQLGFNLFNQFLYRKRKNKIKGLRDKENIEEIIRNTNPSKK